MDKADKDAKANAEKVKGTEATQRGPRGNVYSEPAEEPQHEAPPPLGH